MDNNKEDQIESDNQDIIITADTDSVESNNQVKPQVTTHKAGGGLTLLLSVVALAGCGYLVYKDYMKSEPEPQADNPQINQLMDHDKVFATDIQGIQVELQNLGKQITTTQAQLKTQSPTESNTRITAFDNSENEAALAALKSQLTNHQLNIQQLTEQLSQPNNVVQPNTAQEVVTDTGDFHTKATLETLMITDLLVANNQIQQAKNSLSSHLASANVRPTIRTRINNLINQLNAIEMPETEQLTQELTQLKTLISGLQMPTETQATEETHWYDRFISVKKISEDSSSIGNSAFLEIIKSQLNNHMLQAELAMVMQNQTSWRLQLQAAGQLLEQQLPGQSELAEQLKQLADVAISPSIPDNLSIEGIITDLKGSR